MKKRNQYSAEFKSKVVLEALQEASTVNEIAAMYGINPVVIINNPQISVKRQAELLSINRTSVYRKPSD